MQIIDRYIFKQVFWSYLLLLVTLFLLHIIVDIFVQLSEIIKNRTPLIILLKYYLFLSPQVFLRTSPIAFLVSSLYSIGILNKNNEIISLRTQGLSILGIARIYLIFALLISFFSLFIEDRVLPKSFTHLNVLNYGKKTSRENNISNFSFYAKGGLIIFAKNFETQNNTLTMVKIFIQNKDADIIQEITADELVYEENTWQLKNAHIYEIAENKASIISSGFFKKKEIKILESPQELKLGSTIEWANLSLKDITKQIEKFSFWKEGKIINSLKTELHKKIAFNFSPLFLLLGGLPFALMIRQRKVGLSSLGVSILISFLYYLVFSFGSSLSKSGFFHPLIGCWLANLFLGISGILGLLSLR